MMVKQNYIQKPLLLWVVAGLSTGLCFLCIKPVPGLAQAGLGGVNGDTASVKLLAGKDKIPGSYVIAIDITLKPHSHTYWKAPGDAGVPPVFAFDGSANVAKAEVLYPAPSRITEGGLDAFGYVDHVAFPVVVTPIDPDKPSSLHVSINFAVCNTICIPAVSEADLALPAPASPEQAQSVALAFAAVPKALPNDKRDDLVVARVNGTTKPTWTLTWNGIASVADIFAEAPEGYAFDTKKAAAKGSWTLVASQTAQKATKWVPVTLTLGSDDQSFVTTRTLDLLGSTP